MKRLTLQIELQRREEAAQERELVRNALLSVLDDVRATPGERVEAARLLIECDRANNKGLHNSFCRVEEGGRA